MEYSSDVMLLNDLLARALKEIIPQRFKQITLNCYKPIQTSITKNAFDRLSFRGLAFTFDLSFLHFN